MKSISYILLPAMLALGTLMASGCSGKAQSRTADSDAATVDEQASLPAFDADSAMHYIKVQCDFGPRVPNTEAHRKASAWLAAELERHGAKVTLQPMTLTAFDGTRLNTVNILGQYNPGTPNRTLLLAHYDSRPWADKDPDPANHRKPVPGANDGASGVGVLLEMARIINSSSLASQPIDILFVDAEDWGDSDQDDSWALGTRHFVENPPIAGYRPAQVVLLDMVGGKDAVFRREYFSQTNAPALNEKFWNAAAQAGLKSRFPDEMGGAITDDHVEFLKAGIPAIDIIEYNAEGFNPYWHTVADTYDKLDPSTVADVGTALVRFLHQ